MEVVVSQLQERVCPGSGRFLQERVCTGSRGFFIAGPRLYWKSRFFIVGASSLWKSRFLDYRGGSVLAIAISLI